MSAVLLLWLAGETGGRSVLMISGDLVFAGLFVWCLLGIPRPIR